ncbi:MAG: hypothetical protein N4A45_09220 [Flavobacteriales bacterium]|jgi:hypothetical protein|nr:hypothetical protein [Flavobacteriales bacterium]
MFKFDFKNKPYSIFIDIGLALVLCLAIFLLGNAGYIKQLHPLFYVVFGPMVALLLIRARKREEESTED